MGRCLEDARALSYGLAHMHVDAHLREWPVPSEQAWTAMNAVMQDDLAGLAADPEAARTAMRQSAHG